jgi:hypothetical protein
MNGRPSAQLAARREIIAAVNERRLMNGLRQRAYNVRQINECVHIARKFGLVKGDTLEAAGFNRE